MGLSRRQFTKEFKLAAVRRLEQGVSIAEAARALEVGPNVLQRWRREFREGLVTSFPAMANNAGRRVGSPSWNGRSASRPWRSIF
jgi:transposase-like protein